MREEVKKESYRDKMRRMIKDNKTSSAGKMFNVPEGVEWWKPKDGENVINIIPYTVSIPNHEHANKGEDWFTKNLLVHYSEGKSYICPQTIGKKCPICEHRAELQKEGADKEVIKALYTKKRQLFNVEDLNTPGKVYIWEYSYHLFGKYLEGDLDRLMNRKRSPRPEVAEFFLPDTGFSLAITMTTNPAQGAVKEHKECTAIEYIEREPLEDAVLNKALDLDTILNVMEYDELKKDFLGVVDDTPIPGDEDNPFIQEEPVAPARRKAAVEEAPAPATRRRAAVVEPEPEPEEEEAEPEPEPVPARRRGAVAEAPAKAAKAPACGFGGTWGKDCEKMEACNDECPTAVWEKCLEEQKKMKAAEKK